MFPGSWSETLVEMLLAKLAAVKQEQTWQRASHASSATATGEGPPHEHLPLTHPR